MTTFRRVAAIAKAAPATLLLLICSPGWAQTQMSGSLTATAAFLATQSQIKSVQVDFSCTGAPTCSGTYKETFVFTGCPNPIVHSDTVTLTVNAATPPGPINVAAVWHNQLVQTNFAPACSVTPLSDSPFGLTGSWDGTNGTVNSGQFATNPDKWIYAGQFKLSQPVFSMAVSSNITPTSATASAQIQPRPQDAGTTASVFVFAHAPQSGLGKAAKDGPDPCVLAQLNPNGQLASASASTMQPYTTGVLSSQGQSVSILNNVSTPSVAGATFYVGYGSSSTTMFTNGTYQGAVTVAGATQCNDTLSAAAAPNSPGAVTGLWWNANESGWGIHFTQRGSNTFAAWYTYDTAGKPKWYVATCVGASGTTGTCTGTLYEVTGPSFFGGAFDPSRVSAANAGTLQVTFASATAASMTYTGVAGQTRTVQLTRQPLATGTIPPAVDYSDLWWNSSESGWGMAMAQQFGVTFLAWYIYDAQGKPTWLVSTCTMSGSSCSGAVYSTTGPPFGPTFNSNAVQPSAAGTITVNFTDANHAVLSYTANGVTTTEHVIRQLF
jgi:hypothetical protein